MYMAICNYPLKCTFDGLGGLNRQNALFSVFFGWWIRVAAGQAVSGLVGLRQIDASLIFGFSLVCFSAFEDGRPRRLEGSVLMPDR